MPLKKKSPWGIIVVGIVLLGIIIVAVCDFTPKKEIVEVPIQHTID